MSSFNKRRTQIRRRGWVGERWYCESWGRQVMGTKEDQIRKTEIIKRVRRSRRRRGIGSESRGVVLLLLGEFQSVAEDLERRLFRTESTCFGRLTADTEHRPVKPREYRGGLKRRKAITMVRVSNIL